jgi:hypothetical protein
MTRYLLTMYRITDPEGLSEPVVEPSAVTRGEGPVTLFGVPAQAM